MNPIVSTIIQTIKLENDHSRHVQDVFLRAMCLLEMHYQNHSFSLLDVFPDLDGQTITDAEADEIRLIITQFVETLPNHSAVAAAIIILAKPRDPKLKSFFITQLRLHLGWRNPVVVFHLLLALEDFAGESFLYQRWMLYWFAVSTRHRY